MYADISIMANRCRFFFFPALPCLAFDSRLSFLSLVRYFNVLLEF